MNKEATDKLPYGRLNFSPEVVSAFGFVNLRGKLEKPEEFGGVAQRALDSILGIGGEKHKKVVAFVSLATMEASLLPPSPCHPVFRCQQCGPENSCDGKLGGLALPSFTLLWPECLMLPHQ